VRGHTLAPKDVVCPYQDRCWSSSPWLRAKLHLVAFASALLRPSSFLRHQIGRQGKIREDSTCDESPRSLSSPLVSPSSRSFDVFAQPDFLAVLRQRWWLTSSFWLIEGPRPHRRQLIAQNKMAEICESWLWQLGALVDVGFEVHCYHCFVNLAPHRHEPEP